MIHALGIAVLLAAAPAHDDKPPFEVVPPERAAFNYPAPPDIGPADYFTVAEQGKPRCVIGGRDQRWEAECSGNTEKRRTQRRAHDLCALCFSVLQEQFPATAKCDR